MNDDQLIAKAQADYERRQAALATQRAQEADKTRLRDAVAQDAAERILAMFSAKSEAFLAELGKLKPQQDCERHLGAVAVLNEEASLKAGSPVYRCPVCVDAKAALRWERRLIEAGIPADVRHASFENFQVAREGARTEKGFSTPDVFLVKAKQFFARELRNLFLCGSVGIGKGHLAAAIAIARIDLGFPVLWTDCAALFRACHASYAQDGIEPVLERYAGTSLLILDEVCLNDLPRDGEEILFAIIDRRHKAGLQTLLLGNANAEAARKWLGGRITDRLRSGGVGFCFGEWQSMRGGERDGADF
jgi:DNA replication protein DnaC